MECAALDGDCKTIAGARHTDLVQATTDVYFVPASQLARYTGDVLVGSEMRGRFWIVQPRGRRFRTLLLRTNLPATDSLNLEGAKYLAP